MVLLELSGHGISWIGGSLIAAFKVKDPRVMEVVLNLLIALLIDLVQIACLKGMFKRPRPSYNRSDMFATVSLDNYSFPSGHATRAATVTLLMLKHFNLSVHLRLSITCWCVLIGLSRVMLGRHHVSDVSVGFVIGYLQFLFVEAIWFPLKDMNDFKLSVLRLIS